MNPRIAFVLFHYGAFGGANKRITNLFHFLYKNNPLDTFYIVNYEFYLQIADFIPEALCENIKIVGYDKNQKLKSNDRISPKTNTNERESIFNENFISSKLAKESGYSSFRKLYWFFKNYLRQYRLYREIEKIRAENQINVFMGIYSGILPLYFYFKKKDRPAIVFSDMDSWFYEIHPEEKKYWYRKYYSFNYTFKKCDKIDFLSPFIYKGVSDIGIKISEDRFSITPCSFADYSKCFAGKKQDFGIVFAGRLEKNKNPILFIEAANIILEKYPDVKFYLLGDGQLKEEINEILFKSGIAQKFTFQFHPNPPEIFAETLVFVSLQATNNYPSQSILEAMACGNAIIATDVGDTRMFVNESNGILIIPDLNALVNSIESLIMDKEKALQLGRNAREFVLKNHNIEVHADYYLKLLGDALENSNLK